VQQYFAVPYRNTAHPPISVWELRQARRRLKEEGQKSVNEAVIFDAYNRLRALEAEAVRDTQKTRRSAQRRRLHAQIAPPELSAPGFTPDGAVDNLDDIHPYEEIEELDG
jgi:putative transposase